ncbi:MAG: YitT family protein [Clostridia bacterium]|nr:YitT family protein [Clostridia bacterium]
MKPQKLIRDGISIVLGSALAACAVYFFLIPNDLAVGSVSGISIVLNTFIPLRVTTISLILNVILLLLGAVFIGAGFSGKTVLTTLLYSGMLSGLEFLFPNLEPLTSSPLLDMLCYIFILGLAQAILFSSDASTGGIDIIAKILNKFLHIEIGKAVSTGGLCLALASVFAFDTETVVISLLGTYLNGIVVDHFIFDLNPRRRVCILSEKQQEICRFILEDLHSGASIYEAVGAYTGETHEEIITIVDKNEYRRLMDFIRKTDPDAFLTVYSVHEVHYKAKH